MKITEDRFKSILAGTAPNLTSKEILIRQEAFDAERRGQDPMLAVEAQMPDVTIVRREAYRGTAPPLNVHPENASAKKAVASGIAPGPVSPNSQSLFASIKVYFKLWRRELSRSLRPPVKITASPDTAGSVAARPERGNLSPISVPKQKGTLSSPELVSFSERHGIPLDSFFDAAGMSKAEYARQMEAVGAIIAYNVKPCFKAGHSIRNRYGKCVVCDPKQIAFNQRAFKAGSVYAAYSRSKGLVKVGFAKDVRRRHNVLVRYQYAGATDWELFYQKETKDGGRREIEAHKALAQYAVKGLAYAWDGRTQVAREVYRCTKENAIEALEGR